MYLPTGPHLLSLYVKVAFGAQEGSSSSGGATSLGHGEPRHFQWTLGLGLGR